MILWKRRGAIKEGEYGKNRNNRKTHFESESDIDVTTLTMYENNMEIKY